MSDATLVLLRARLATRTPLTPRERTQVAEAMVAPWYGTISQARALWGLMRQNTEPMLCGEDARDFERKIRAVETAGELDPWDADRLIERTVYRGCEGCGQCEREREAPAPAPAGEVDRGDSADEPQDADWLDFLE